MVDYPEQIKSSCITHLIIKPTLHSLEQIENFKKLGIPLIFTSTFETSVGLWHIAQLSQRYSPKQVHGFATLDWFKEDLCLDPMLLNKDKLLVPASLPGLNSNLLTLEFS